MKGRDRLQVRRRLPNPGLRGRERGYLPMSNVHLPRRCPVNNPWIAKLHYLIDRFNRFRAEKVSGPSKHSKRPIGGSYRYEIAHETFTFTVPPPECI